MTVGELVSVKTNVPLVDEITPGKKVQVTGGTSLVVQRTSNCSSVGADHFKVAPLGVTDTLLMVGTGVDETTDVGTRINR